MLGKFTHALDVGIDLRSSEFFIGLVLLKCPCTLYDKLFQMIDVVIYNVYFDCKMIFSGDRVSLRHSSDPSAKEALQIAIFVEELPFLERIAHDLIMMSR